ncbi:hypothetical protein UlMin_025494 [Ulmus minor]
MEKQTIFFWFAFFLLFILININVFTVEAEKELPKHNHHHHHNRSSNLKLFVFGDSYADTGNSRTTAVSWETPYGITFPRKPAGRFSDGRVLTDYLASFLGIKSPVAYRWRKSVKKSKLKFGMNFAFGGTGVFNTFGNEPNMSTQIDFFRQLLDQQQFYTKQDLKTSIAFISLAGNDYAAHIAKGANNMEDLKNASRTIVDQLCTNVKRLQSMGVPKIAVTALEPLGCLPPFTASSSFQNCSTTWNSVSQYHNQILQQKIVQNLNNESEKNELAVLDLHSSFMSAFKIMHKINDTGNLTLENNAMKPCCVGIGTGFSCGSVDERGATKYSLCKDPELSFFWDMIHPSQNGWHAVFSELLQHSSLYKLV